MSRIFAAQLLGMAIGPVVGVVVGVRDLGVAFAATGVLSLVAAVVAARTDLGGVVDTTRAPAAAAAGIASWSARSSPRASVGLVIGVYEACWSLLMHDHHASLTADPPELDDVLHPLRRAQRRRRLARRPLESSRHRPVRTDERARSSSPSTRTSTTTSCCCVLGSLESIGAALTAPAAASLLTQGAEDRELSRRQGLYTTANTGSLAAAAACRV